MKWFGAFLLLAFCFRPLWADDSETSEANPELIAVDGYVVFFNAQGPMSYVTSTLRDLPPNAVPLGEVHSEVCQHGLSLPITVNAGDQSGKISGALGNGGYQKAFDRIKKQYPGIQGLYDVQVDLHEIRILSIYSKLCTTITALAFK